MDPVTLSQVVPRLPRLQVGDPASIGPFEVLGRLGAGGMGVVYLGRDQQHGLAAVKVVRDELAHQAGFRTRFAREVTAMERVKAVYSAPVLASDVEAAGQWVATEYVPGPTLAEYVEETGAMPAGQVRLLALGLAQALVGIHAAGLVHRDLKPSNVILSGTGPKVIDFCIAQIVDATSLTQTGAYLGSLAWMAPEQVLGDTITAATDVFAVGLLMGYAFAGRHMYGEGRPEAVAYRITHQEPDLAGFPHDLADVATRCLRVDPAARPTAEEIVGRLAGRGHTLVDVTDAMARSWDPALPAEPTGEPATRSLSDAVWSGRRHRRGTIALAAIIAALLGGGVAVAAGSDSLAQLGGDAETRPAAIPTPDPARQGQESRNPDDTAPSSPSPASGPTTSPMEGAVADFPNVQASNPEETFSEIIWDEVEPWMISVNGGAVRKWRWASFWRDFEMAYFEAVDLQRIERTDANADGIMDFLLFGQDDQGSQGAVVIDDGNYVRLADLVYLDGQKYGAAAGLMWDGARLTSDDGQTTWVYEQRQARRPSFVAEPS